MKKLWCCLVIGLAALQVGAAELAWLTDLAKAQAQAKEEKKMVLMNFTGSDWCGFCIKLHKEVFSSTEFAEYAKKNLVLVEVDFPSKKQLSAALTKANDALKEKYKIKGFPTLVVLNSEGKKVGEEVGYGGGGPKAVIAKIDKFRSK